MIEPVFISYGGGKRTHLAIPERISRLAGRVEKWVGLRSKPNREKKIVLILHNAVCSGVEATIGPVSYTHLDVYKRQSWECVSRKFSKPILTPDGWRKMCIRDSSEFSLQHRGGKGNLYYRITKKTGDVVSFKLVNKEQDLMLITDGGIIIRLRVEDISEIGRITSGVKLMGLEGDTKVVSIAKIREEQVEEDTDDPLAGMDFDDVAPEDE